MQKFNEPCINTGNFAKLCNTNKRTLIHYDEIGLFSPEYTDEKGYRFYTESQADVFFTISCLKDIGMSLAEIRSFLNDRNPEKFKELLEKQQKKVDQELEHLKRIKQVISTKTKLLKIGEGISFEHQLSKVQIERMPEEYLILSPKLDTGDHEILFKAICQHIAECNQKELTTGYPYGAMLLSEKLGENREDVYAHFFTKVSEKPRVGDCTVKPAGEYAVIYLKGDYYNAEEAYKQLLNYCDENGFHKGEYCYKEAIWDEVATPEREYYITKISIKIE